MSNATVSALELTPASVLPEPFKLYPNSRFTAEQRQFHDDYWTAKLAYAAKEIASLEQRNRDREEIERGWEALGGKSRFGVEFKANPLDSPRGIEMRRLDDLARDALANTASMTLPDWREIEDCEHAVLLLGIHDEDMRKFLLSHKAGLNQYFAGFQTLMDTTEVISERFDFIGFGITYWKKGRSGWYAGFQGCTDFPIHGTMPTDEKWQESAAVAILKAIMDCITRKTTR